MSSAWRRLPGARHALLLALALCWCVSVAGEVPFPSAPGKPFSWRSQASPKPEADKVTPALLLPVAVAYDHAGNLFFADARRHQIFELTVAGVWSVLAGTGEQGFAGDGGSATAALLDTPRGLAVGLDGTVYVADSGNQRIRAIANGSINTVAGTGVRGNGADGVALKSALADPTALATDASGNLLICDTGNQRVRRMSGSNVVTIAGTGVQGFSGDGGVATAAALDTPLGVAVTTSGAILIADTHNDRVRLVSVDGTISTFAGAGQRGFAGDGAAASLAKLDLPSGLAIATDGSVLIADTGNQRIRSVTVAGIITTLAGNSVQGNSSEATLGTAAALNTPRAVSLQLQGQAVFADAGNALVRELADDNSLYTLALLSAPRASSTVIYAPSPAVYGQASASVAVSGGAATPQGALVLFDSGTQVLSAQLVGGASSIDLSQLATGSHMLNAAYSGDGLNGSSTSPATALVIAPAPVLATASAATAIYGGSIPSLTGTVTGILPRDVTTVQAAFSSSATSRSPAGTYPISASLIGQGSANYSLSIGANSGLLTISQAPTVTTLAPIAQTYAGLPTLLAASVSTTTSGSPSGLVDFLDGSSIIASVPIVNGGVSASILSSTQGSHTFSAHYHGDIDFLTSSSSATYVSVAAMPDFTLALASSSQSVQGGSVAVFTLSVTPVSGPFTGVVTMSASGLPQGATASFSPMSVIPGASVASVTLSLQTVAKSAAVRNVQNVRWACALGLFTAVCLLPAQRRRRQQLRSLLLMLLLCMASMIGCGTRTAGAPTATGQTYSLSVRGTGTNLAGAAVTHDTVATLTVF